MDYLKAFKNYCEMREHQFFPEIPAKNLPEPVRQQNFRDNLKVAKYNFEKDLDKEIENIQSQAAKENNVLTLADLNQLQNIKRDAIRKFLDTYS